MASNIFTRVLVALYFLCAVLADDPASSTFSSSTDSNNLTVAINVPNNETDSLFFRFSAPTQYAWAAFGFGSQMSNSLIFMLYSSSNGKNVTLSARTTTGHNPPTQNKDVVIKVLDGSGIIDGKTMLVNAKCNNCRSWGGNSINIQSTSQPLIWAYGPTGSLTKSDDQGLQFTQIHSEMHSGISVDLKKATGQPGVPVIASSSGSSTDNSSGGTVVEQAKAEFPIAVHALLVIAALLFIFPSGYLFLRVFERVWLHASIQVFGIVVLLGGVAAGIVYNVNNQIALSYHQILGGITSLAVLIAFTLGLVSHQYFKKRKVKSPLMIYHRFVGPFAIVFGWGTIISGFIFRGEPRRILPFAVVLLAVIIFVGAIAFLMQKRKVRKQAHVTPAAQNFTAGYYGETAPTGGNPYPGGEAEGYFSGRTHAHGEGVPMQTFEQPYQHQQQAGGYGYGGAGYGQQGYKAPDVSVRPA